MRGTELKALELLLGIAAMSGMSSAKLQPIAGKVIRLVEERCLL